MRPALADQSAGLNEHSFLRAEGRWIVDEQGNVVLLRGVNFFGYEYGVWANVDYRTHSENDYRIIASWGFNVVRLPIAWNFIEPQQGKYDESYFSKYVDNDIAWAKKYNLYIILDMHNAYWSPHFTYYDWPASGLPNWAVSGYPNDAAGQAQSMADFYTGLGPNGTSSSSANPSLQDRFIEMWKYVASRYAHESTIAGYDILNEPTILSSDGKVELYPKFRFCLQTLPTFLTRVVDAIRSVDPHHMILWEPSPSWTCYGLVAPVNRTNVVFSPHYPGDTGIRSYDGNKTMVESLLTKYIVEPSLKWNQPTVIGEWGIIANKPNAVQYVKDLADLFDKYLLGSLWWTYGRSTFGMTLFDQNGDERTILTKNLVRPYLRGSSSPPFTSSYNDRANWFQVRTDGPGTVRIFVPTSYTTVAVKTDYGNVSSSWIATSHVLLVSMSNYTSQVMLYLG